MNKRNMFIEELFISDLSWCVDSTRHTSDPSLPFSLYMIAHIMSHKLAFWEAKRGLNVQKWVSDAYPENTCQLDHCVVFGTKSGAVQNFQRGKSALFELGP